MNGGLKIKINNKSGFRLNTDAAERVATEVLTALGLEKGEVGITFVSAEEIGALNNKYLGRNGATDVISFPIDVDEDGAQTPEPAPRLLGDVVICPEVAAREVSNHGGKLENEICLLVVHGILHLAGFDHEVDKGEMDEKQAGFYEELCK